VLQNISDLTQQAIVDAIQLDAANGFLADALDRESGQREAGGQAVLHHLQNLSDDGVAACHSVTSGRAAVQEALSKAQDILSSQNSSDKESKFQLEQSTNLLEKATEQAKFLSEGVQNQLQDYMNELSTVVAGFQSAKEGLDVSLSQNVEAQDVIEQALRELIVRTHFDSMRLNFVKIAWPFGWSMRRMVYENEDYDCSGIFLWGYVKIYPNSLAWFLAQDAAETSFPTPVASSKPESNNSERVVEILRRVFANHSEHRNYAGRIQGRDNKTCSMGKQIDFLLAEGVSSVWTAMNESLGDWRTAVAAQHDQLTSLRFNVK
jgi:hypothetical protein